jgi:hypothetical protein
MISDTDLPHQPDTLQQQPSRSFKLLIWKVSFILLLIVDAMLGYLLYSTWGDRVELIKVSFLLLPIVNLMFCCGLLIINGSLLRGGFVLLIIVNLMFGYNVYDQERYGVGAGFLAVIPFVFVLAINDLFAVLFYIRKQHPQGIAKVICYAVLIFISVVLIGSFLLFQSIILYFIEAIFAFIMP